MVVVRFLSVPACSCKQFSVVRSAPADLFLFHPYVFDAHRQKVTPSSQCKFFLTSASRAHLNRNFSPPPTEYPSVNMLCLLNGYFPPRNRGTDSP